MFSYDENSVSIKETSTESDYTSKSSAILPFKSLQNAVSYFPNSFYTFGPQNMSVDNNLSASTVSKKSNSTTSNNKSINTVHQKYPWQQRSLLWSPPQIISSVLKVFRKVLSILLSVSFYCRTT